EQITISCFLYSVWHLLLEPRCGGVFPFGVFKYEGVVESNSVNKITRLGVVFIGLSRETDDNVGSKRNPGRDETNPVNELRIRFRGISAMHRFQDPVGCGLQRQMNMFGQLWQPSKRFDGILSKTDRVRRCKPDTLKSVDLVDSFQQLNKRAF